LTLTLLLSVLEHHFLDLGLRVEHIEYKNLAPLFVDEILTVCGKVKNGGGGGAWDVWIEGPKGGLAVRGTVRTTCV
jgi:hydroxyacyl-ACP dehydratase HTD2-like protein with hotdog domain